MKKSLILPVFFFVSVNIFTPIVKAGVAGYIQEWVVRYANANDFNPDEPSAIAVDNSGYVYVTGKGRENSGADYDYVTLKYDSKGILVRKMVFEGLTDMMFPTSDFPRDIEVDGFGNVYVTGDSGNDYLTIKYDPNGTELWTSRYDYQFGSIERVVALALDGIGNVYVTGKSEGTSTSDYDYATVKYDPNGIELWVARYDNGMNGNDMPTSIAVDDSGNVYVTGSSSSSGNGYDWLTVMYDTDGNEEWVWRFDSPQHHDDYANDIAVDDDGRVYVTGSIYIEATGEQEDFYTVACYGPCAVSLWSDLYDGTGSGEDVAGSIALKTLGGSRYTYITGRSFNEYGNYDYVTIKMDGVGNQLWLSKYSGPGVYNEPQAGIAVDDSGNVYVSGRSTDPNTFGYDFATVRYDTDGQQVWAARYDGPANGADEAIDMTIDQWGNIYVTGRSEGIGTGMDWATIKYSWKRCTDPIPGDANGDCKIDFTDLSIIAQHWLECNIEPQPACWE
jgi:hypothetical protein